MSAARLGAAFLSALLSAGCFYALGPLARFARQEFRRAEPYFAAPLSPAAGALRIRSDINGKGFFGASRNGNRIHQGLDFLAPIGDPVYAAKSGRVSLAGWQKGFGGVVKILHADGSTSIYAHLSKTLTHTGDWAPAGTPVGRVGKSGNASDPKTLPHLHFEIRANNKPVNPTKNQINPQIKIL